MKNLDQIIREEPGMKVESFDDFKTKYDTLDPEDQAKVLDVLRVAKGRQQGKDAALKGSVPGVYGAFISVGEDGLALHLPLIPGILDIHLKKEDLLKLWDWLTGE